MKFWPKTRIRTISPPQAAEAPDWKERAATARLLRRKNDAVLFEGMIAQMQRDAARPATGK